MAIEQMVVYVSDWDGHAKYVRTVYLEEGPVIARFYYGKGRLHLWQVPPGLYRLSLERLDEEQP